MKKSKGYFYIWHEETVNFVQFETLSTSHWTVLALLTRCYLWLAKFVTWPPANDSSPQHAPPTAPFLLINVHRQTEFARQFLSLACPGCLCIVFTHIHFVQMKALTLLIALIGVVAAEVFLDERFSDGGKKDTFSFLFPFYVDGWRRGFTCQGGEGSHF